MKKHKVLLVAEAGINHSGNIDIAKHLVDIASRYDNDYIKFQRRTVDLVYTKEELDKPRESLFGTTTREQKYGIELSQDQYREIDQHCFMKGIKWFASPWDPVSVQNMLEFKPLYMKIPSALIVNFELLEAVKDTNIPIIISTGMSTKQEVDNCLNYLGNQVEYILACCSTYPTKDEEMNMNFIKTLKYEYGDHYRIGFSNHSPSPYFCTIAPLLGAEMIEYHITHDRADKNSSDNAASIEEAGVRMISNHVRSLEVAMGDGQWGVRASEEPIKKKLRFTTYNR